MSNPLKKISVPHIANAVARTLANQKKHVEYKETKALILESKAKVETKEMELEIQALELLPVAEEIIGKSMLVMERGYLATHRKLGHLLPDHLKWTVDGVLVINALLERIPVTAPYMPKWAVEIEKHIEETREQEIKKAQRAQEYDAANDEVYDIIVNEIIRLYKLQSPFRHNYGKLFNWLRNGLPHGFRGSRGVRLIHRAMTERITGTEMWKQWMDADLEAAVVRDREYRERMRNGEAGGMSDTGSTYQHINES